MGEVNDLGLGLEWRERKTTVKVLGFSLMFGWAFGKTDESIQFVYDVRDLIKETGNVRRIAGLQDTIDRVISGDLVFEREISVLDYMEEEYWKGVLRIMEQTKIKRNKKS